MFCPKCGTENPNDATYCQKCGNALQTTNLGSQPPSSSSSPSYSQNPQSAAKSPIIAAVLNLFFGVGYFYLGYRKVLGLQTIVSVILIFVLCVIIGYFTLGIGPVIIIVVLAIDGYQKGKGQKGFISAEM